MDDYGHNETPSSNSCCFPWKDGLEPATGSSNIPFLLKLLLSDFIIATGKETTTVCGSALRRKETVTFNTHMNCGHNKPATGQHPQSFKSRLGELEWSSGEDMDQKLEDVCWAGETGELGEELLRASRRTSYREDSRFPTASQRQPTLRPLGRQSTHL